MGNGIITATWIEWLERPAANATVLDSIPNILRHSGICGAADEAALNKVQKTITAIIKHQKGIAMGRKPS